MTTDSTSADVGVELTELTEIVRSTDEDDCVLIYCPPIVVPTNS